jgi:UPF0755 protein
MIRLIAVLVGLVVCAAVALTVWMLTGSVDGGLRFALGALDQPVDPNGQPVLFTVEPGQSASEIGAALERRGLIRSALAFRVVLERRGLAHRLAAGDYELSPAMTTTQIAEILASGAVRASPRLTVPEGWRAEQIADRLDALGQVRGADFLRLVRSPGALKGAVVPAEAPTLEGYLFPETYTLDSRTDAAELVRRMLEQFNLAFGPELRRQVRSQGLTVHEAVTLASIVEREAQVPAERPLIAAVFLNRLRLGMPLQADPTVQYALANLDLARALSFGYWKPLAPEDLAVASPFNTYLVPGLPPGPICNPGLASLQAVAAPAEVGYRYFVARNDGTHLFADTLEEHERNVAASR